MRLTDLVTPLKPLEAMAMGKALVASDVGGHKELIRDGENGKLFSAGDKDALARTLQELISDRSGRKALQESAQAWVNQNHTWARTTAVYQDIYSSLHRGSGTNDK